MHQDHLHNTRQNDGLSINAGKLIRLERMGSNEPRSFEAEIADKKMERCSDEENNRNEEAFQCLKKNKRHVHLDEMLTNWISAREVKFSFLFTK